MRADPSRDTIQLRVHAEERPHGLSWLELFFDVVYVAALIQLGDALAEDLTWKGAGNFALAFTVLWWTWTGTTFYFNRVLVDDVVHRLLVLLQIVVIGALAVQAPNALAGAGVGFALSYAAVRVILLLLYARALRRFEALQPLSQVFSLSYGAGATLFVLSTILPDDWRAPIWVLAIAIELSVPLTRWAQHRLVSLPVESGHLAERFAVLTIIVLGESFVKMIGALVDHGITGEVVVYGGLAYVGAAAMWWTYFDDIADSRVRTTGWMTLSRSVWLYTHLPLAAAITAYGVAAKKLVVLDSLTDPLSSKILTLLAGSALLVMATVAVIDAVTVSPFYGVSDRFRVRSRLVAAGAIGVIGLFGSMLPGWMAAGGIILAAVVQIAAETLLASRAQGIVFGSEEDLAKFDSCADLDAVEPEDVPEIPDACPECLASDTPWVQLRTCIECGHVGCCDDSPVSHARLHWVETGHPIVANDQRRNRWLWCYDHEALRRFPG